MAVRHHQTQHLANVLHTLSGKNGFIMDKRGQQFVARNIVSGDNRSHTRCGEHRAQVQRHHAPPRHRAEDGRSMQRAFGQGQVVNVGCESLHMQVRTFVLCRFVKRLRVHVKSSNCVTPWLTDSSHARCSKLRSSSRR